MIKTRTSHLLLFTAIITFLAVQWSGTHIHLPSSHSHEQDYHQHPCEVHSHQSVDIGSIAEGGGSNRHSAIAKDFGEEYRFSNNKKQKKPLFADVVTGFKIQNSLVDTRITRTVINAELRDFNRSTIIPRAPPYIS